MRGMPGWLAAVLVTLNSTDALALGGQWLVVRLSAISVGVIECGTSRLRLRVTFLIRSNPLYSRKYSLAAQYSYKFYQTRQETDPHSSSLSSQRREISQNASRIMYDRVSPLIRHRLHLLE